MKRNHFLPFLITLSIGLLSGCATHPKGLETDTVSIPCYKGVNVVSADAEVVTEEDIENQIQGLIDAHQRLTDITGRGVQAGDLVTASYAAFVDGMPFDSASGRTFTAGSLDDPEGLTESFLGHAAGETYTWEITIPDTHPDGNLWGRTAVYEITIEKIQVSEPLSLTDRFVAETVDGADSVKDLERETKKSLEESREKQAKAEQKDALWSELIDSVTIKSYPEERVAAMQELALERAQGQAAFENLSYEEWLLKYHYESHEAFAASAAEKARADLREILAAEAILEKEHITVNQKDYDNWMDADFRAAMERNHTEEEMWDLLRIETAKEWVSKHCNEIDVIQ